MSIIRSIVFWRKKKNCDESMRGKSKDIKSFFLSRTQYTNAKYKRMQSYKKSAWKQFSLMKTTASKLKRMNYDTHVQRTAYTLIQPKGTCMAWLSLAMANGEWNNKKIDVEWKSKIKVLKPLNRRINGIDWHILILLFGSDRERVKQTKAHRSGDRKREGTRTVQCTCERGMRERAIRAKVWRDWVKEWTNEQNLNLRLHFSLSMFIICQLFARAVLLLIIKIDLVVSKMKIFQQQKEKQQQKQKQQR